MSFVGLVLAAGAGRRMGRPKALLRDEAGTPWVRIAADLLSAAGADEVLVMLGAQAEQAADLVPDGAQPVVVPDWEEGISASVGAGLQAAQRRAAASGAQPCGALITLVDLPRMVPEAVARVLAQPLSPADLRRASYGGRPGHPVFIGRDHWAELSGQLRADIGAREYLRRHGVAHVDCTDLPGGDDIDSLPLPGADAAGG
ncbi:nucleotidyltransferase family protein [Nesterenkonia sp.]|uniref:nucleotidyltransferase family protein n=1 Tax=Nesterenkonia sp. TaxID=704201 RepID=UPI002628B3C2|nr:nucleotidyltransferase family protein [Nesterenkonia sp.]